MPSIDRRITALEGHVPDTRYIDWLVEHGREHDLANEDNFRRFLDDMEALEKEHSIAPAGQWISGKYLNDPREKRWAFFILTEAERDTFAIEQLRGLWPDRLLRTVYSYMRNWAFPADVALRVRQLAGVVYDSGNPLPGFKLLDNGGIVDAPQAAENPAP